MKNNNNKMTDTRYSTQKYLLSQASMLNPIQESKKCLTERYLFLHLLRGLSMGGVTLLTHFLHFLLHSTHTFGYLLDLRSLKVGPEIGENTELS